MIIKHKNKGSLENLYGIKLVFMNKKENLNFVINQTFCWMSVNL